MAGRVADGIESAAAGQGRWTGRLFWAWQGLYLLMILMVLAAVVLEGPLGPRSGLVEALGFPVYLAPLLGPAWLPVTLLLGLLMLLRRRGRAPR